MDTEKQSTNRQDNAPSEEKKPVIDQMTDLAAEAAGALAETAVKTVAKKAKKAVAINQYISKQTFLDMTTRI